MQFSNEILREHAMKVLSEIEVAIRMATTESVNVSGRKQAAAVLETNTGKICRLENTDNSPTAASERMYLKASEAVKLDRLAGAPFILEAMARLEGFELTRAEPGIAAEGMSQHLVAIAKKFADALAEMATAARDNNTSVSEAKRIHSALHDLICCEQDVMRECERIIAGEKPKLSAVS